ncbi:MAG: polysaccharide lyase 6 family protein, partial [Sphingopyxis sp.]
MLASAAHPALARDRLVTDQAQYRAAVKKSQPGDTIILADGEWCDFQIVFTGSGSAAKPITLTAQTKGKVTITGQSNLRIGGQHLLVSGLVFKNGASPTGEVISFRRDSKTLANDTRVTEVVIDGYSKVDRRAEDIWVALYGTGNRVDHSHFEGKTNSGVTLAVIRRAGEPLDNRHRIDHNYFGPRPPLGSNGGETIRIGTSEESLSASNTTIERNIFDRTSGEVEIVSIKSGGNIIRENLLLEAQGAIVLRHGNGNLVERNIFLGKGVPDTGGVRVINRDQIVRGNYFEGLAGTSFKSAISVMNGVPNSVINRYHQVANARIEGNSII